MEAALILVGSCLFPPILGTVLLVLILATFGKSFGVREKYVRLLLRIFEVRVSFHSKLCFGFQWGSRQIDSSQLWIDDTTTKGCVDDEMEADDDADTGVDTATSSSDSGGDEQQQQRFRHGSGNLSAGMFV